MTNTPEAFALDEHELPRETYHASSSDVSDQLTNPEQGFRIFRWMLCLLHLNQWVSVSELKDLWVTLLTTDHRILILQQLHDINEDEDETKILSILHSTILSELINAWAQFKLFPHQAFPEAFPYASSAKDTIFEVLKYCTTLEAIINKGRQNSNRSGLLGS
ncbi:hypothetical protein ABVK25_000377 [Lepraria finkii]|uniref:Uncharacterized protein n=1 Tax=Lepraria finkii TaxID=1340010 RepID=A0ABR4BMZ7_9LECA